MNKIERATRNFPLNLLEHSHSFSHSPTRSLAHTCRIKCKQRDTSKFSKTWYGCLCLFLLSCIMESCVVQYPMYNVHERKSYNDFFLEICWCCWWWWWDEQENIPNGKFHWTTYFAKLYAYKHGKIWEMRKKSQICACIFFLRWNISFFSIRSFRFRYFVGHLIFRLRWWRITLTNQIYSEAELFSLSLSWFNRYWVVLFEKNVTIRCCFLLSFYLSFAQLQ